MRLSTARTIAAGTLLAFTVPLLASCAATGAASPSSDEPTAASIQFGWLPNVENMATIVADEEGYFEEEGIDLTILPGGPDVVADAQIVSGNALMGVLSAEVLANAVIAGADLVAVGATYQTTSSTIISLADSGIDEPADLEGKKFGISQTDARVYAPFFELTDVDFAAIEQVPTGADPAALASGEVDAMSGTLANQPVALRSQGFDVNTIRLSDYGYNRWSGLFVVRRESLEDEAERAQIVAMLTAISRGIDDAVADPEAAGKTVFNAYGEQLGLELETQVEGAKIWAELSQENTEDTGLLRVDEAALADLQEFYDAVGIEATAADIFDLSVGDEVFGD
jgi:ABC-type nitrate/sulfonate/bicarbonate transport system substrate-binding protein